MKTWLNLSIVLTLLLVQGVGVADVIVVRKDGKGNLTRVQEALDYSEPGDVIEVADDSHYVEDLNLSSYPSRKIHAASGKRPTINGNVVMGNKCVLEGLVIEPLEYEFWGSIRCNHLPDGCVIRNCRITGAKAIGRRANQKGEYPVMITVWYGSKGVQIVGNEFHTANYAAFLDSAPQDTLFVGNVVINCNFGIRMDGASGDTTDTVIEGNTFVRCGKAVFHATENRIKRLRNNIFALGGIGLSGSGTRELRDNLFYKNTTDCEGGIARTPTDLVADPGFVDADKGDYRLKDQNRFPHLGAYGQREAVAAPPWENEFSSQKAARKDYRALHQKFGWLQEKLDNLPQEGGEIVIPAGAHELYSTLLLNDLRNVTLRGAGREQTRVKMLKDVKFLSAKRCNYLKVENLTIEGLTSATGFYWLEVHNSSITGVRTTGAYLDSCDNDSISQSEILNGGLWITISRGIQVTENVFEGSGGHVIDMNGGNEKCLVKNNRFSGGDAIHVYFSYQNTIVENLFTRMRGAIDIMHGSDNLVAQNVIREGINRPGISLDAKNTSSAAGNRIIANLIYNNKADGLKFYVYEPTPEDPRIKEALKNPNIIEGNVVHANEGAGMDWSEASQHNYDAPVIRHNIVVGNKGVGIAGSRVLASYNNVWSNQGGNYQDCSPGVGSLNADPLFADPNSGDFHLKSRAGRWDSKIRTWVKDDVHSPCIDAGDPQADCTEEPEPNGRRIDLGAYGNSKEASKSLEERK